MTVYADFTQINDTIGPLSLLCGNGNAAAMETRTSVMFVQFISNNILSHTGFNMSYGQIQSKLAFLNSF